jgi:FKBP-type peptidyl-prolyl cis-trans isomerases 1
MPKNYKLMEPKRYKVIAPAILLLLSLSQCSGQGENQATERRQPNQEERMDARRSFVEKEMSSIELYLADRNLDMQRSGTGLFYQVDRHERDTLRIESGDRVFYHYQIYLLNGTLLYASAEGQPAALQVDREDAIIGLHEALKYLSLGDSGRFVIPSHLAYGISGDQKKVPPLTALHYDLQVVAIEKLKP